MSIDKSMYTAPRGLGLAALVPDENVEFEVDNEDGLEESDLTASNESSFDDNLAEEMDESDLMALAQELIADYEDDDMARRDWMQTYVDGLELLGMKIEDRSEPWEGACGVYHPLLSESLVKFQAETMMSTFPAAGPVRTQIIGKETPDKKKAAARVQEDMNYQLMDVMSEYRPEHERMLWGLGLSGNAFKKVYYDPNLARQVSVFVPAEDIIVPYGASNLETSPRITHVMRKTENEMRRLQVSGFYRDEDMGEPVSFLDDIEKKIADKMGFRATSDDRYKVLEMHVDIDLPGYEHTDEDGDETGIHLPYVITIEKSTQTVLSIRRNWEEGDDTYKKRQHFVHYGYVPGFGFYCFGLIHLVGAFAKSSTSLIRQLVDAGTLSNLPGGFKSRGLRVKGDDTPISPGEFRDVDVPSGTIKDNLMTLPYKEPSQVLMQLLATIVEDGRRFANAADIQISDMSGQAPVGTTLAILERTLKTMTAIQARIHYSMQQELRLLKEIIANYSPGDYDYDPDEGSRRAKKSDYKDVLVIPVSDPNASTMAQKIVQYQAVIQLAQGAPQIYNMPLLHRQMIDVLGVKDAHKLIPMNEDQIPIDPITENQDALKTKPLKAFLNQDHQAHMTVHQSLLQDKSIMGALQGNPALGQIQSGLAAHIAEHLGFQYRKDIEKQLGMQMPQQDDKDGEHKPLNPEIEAQLSPLLAQAATQLQQANNQEMAQKQAQAQAQDPIIQMQQQELQIKAQEQQRKATKDQTDAQIEQQKLQIERERIASQQQIAQGHQQIAVSDAQAKLALDERKLKVATLKNAAEMTMKEKQADKDLKISVLKSAAEMTLEKDKHTLDTVHTGLQQHLDRTREDQKHVKDEEHKIIDVMHGAYQNHMDKQHEAYQNHMDKQHEEKMGVMDIMKHVIGQAAPAVSAVNENGAQE